MSETKTKKYPHESENWNGYTLEELRYLRAYTAARIEINKERIRQSFSSAQTVPMLRAEGIMGKVIGSLSYVDLAVMAYKIGSRVFKTIRRFRRK